MRFYARQHTAMSIYDRGGVALTAQGSELIDKILTSDGRTPKSTLAKFDWPRASMREHALASFFVVDCTAWQSPSSGV